MIIKPTRVQVAMSEFINHHKKYKKLFSNNKEFVHQKVAQDPQFFTNLSKGQSPEYLFIACSDSRVSTD